MQHLEHGGPVSQLTTAGLQSHASTTSSNAVPSFKGMSSESFHSYVRERLEKVAQAALDRTDGERDYKRKESLIKTRLR